MLHNYAALSRGGVSGLQAAQADWSPYVVHFTSFQAMHRVREEFMQGAPPHVVQGLLDAADQESFEVVNAIAKSSRLGISSPAQKDEIPPCVCLTECTISGLISNAERYGRFGFVFEKVQLFPIGGGPCLYVSPEEYAEIVQAFKESDQPIHQRIFGRSNVMNPAGVGGKIQDYSHEREWRVFADIEFDQITPKFVLAPAKYQNQVANVFHGTVLPLPLDTLFEWGA